MEITYFSLPIFSVCLSPPPPSRSVSMTDMRGEEDAILQPHSQVRHELMHNQYNQMKEEDDHWQDVSVSDLSDSELMFLFLSFLILIKTIFAVMFCCSDFTCFTYAVCISCPSCVLGHSSASGLTHWTKPCCLVSAGTETLFSVCLRTWPDGRIGGGVFPRT